MGGGLSNIAMPVSRVNKGTRRSQTIEREIASQLGLTEAETFPECRYAYTEGAADVGEGDAALAEEC